MKMRFRPAVKFIAVSLLVLEVLTHKPLAGMRTIIQTAAHQTHGRPERRIDVKIPLTLEITMKSHLRV
jgi:hypothetical protein